MSVELDLIFHAFDFSFGTYFEANLRRFTYFARIRLLTYRSNLTKPRPPSESNGLALSFPSLVMPMMSFYLFVCVSKVKGFVLNKFKCGPVLGLMKRPKLHIFVCICGGINPHSTVESNQTHDTM